MLYSGTSESQSWCLGELQRSCTHAQEYKAQKLRAPHAKRAMLAVQTMIHRTQCTPLRWHCSQATAIDKHNGKTGAQGSRLIHVLDPWGKGFCATKHVLEPLGPNDTGFAANRRREYATLTQNTVNEKLTRLGRCCIKNNHDCTNAFCCTTHDTCDEVCDQLFSTAADRELGKQRHRWSSMRVQAREDFRDPEGQLFMRPYQGNLQGDTQAVHSFPRAFQDPVEKWQQGHAAMYAAFEHSAPNDHLYCMSKCPQTGVSVDLSLTKYADDLVKTIIGPDCEREEERSDGLIRRAEASLLLLSHSL